MPTDRTFDWFSLLCRELPVCNFPLRGNVVYNLNLQCWEGDPGETAAALPSSVGGS